MSSISLLCEANELAFNTEPGSLNTHQLTDHMVTEQEVFTDPKELVSHLTKNLSGINTGK